MFTVIVAWLCFNMGSCAGTQYTTKENCYTCRDLVFYNEEYSEEKFGEIKRVKDSIFDEYLKEAPLSAIAEPLSGYFRIKEIWRQQDVIVVFLEDVSDPHPWSCLQVVSLAGEPNYKGKSLKVGKVYHFELSPLFPINKAPSIGLEFQSKEMSILDHLLIENRWLKILHYSGKNVFTSSNLNGDKYILSPKTHKANTTK